MNLHISLPVPTNLSSSSTSKYSAAQLVAPGEIICEAAGFMRGHGTYIHQGNIVAAVSGVVERVNKFICVRPLKSRYTGDVADVLVGRISMVQQNRWKVDVQGRQDATLQLSAVDLPGDVIRRKTVHDQLQMRSIYVENDMISAECHQIGDNNLSIHTRLRYGKLTCGQCIVVPPNLIRRSKTHFVTLECGVDLILANNGYVWISPSTNKDEMDEDNKAVDNKNTPSLSSVPPEIRENMARVRNSIVILSKRWIPIHTSTIKHVYNLSLKVEMQPKDMMLPDSITMLTEDAANALGDINT